MSAFRRVDIVRNTSISALKMLLAIIGLKQSSN